MRTLRLLCLATLAGVATVLVALIGVFPLVMGIVNRDSTTPSWVSSVSVLVLVFVVPLVAGAVTGTLTFRAMTRRARTG